MIFCFQIFFHKCKLWIVYRKNYFNKAKIFVLRLYKMLANQTECSKTWTEVCPQIFGGREVQTMWILLKNVRCVRRSMFLSKYVLKWAKHGFVTMSLSREDSRWNRNVPGAGLSKERHADSLLEYGKTHHNWFCWKGDSFCQLQNSQNKTKFTWIIEWPSYIYIYITFSCDLSQSSIALGWSPSVQYSHRVDAYKSLLVGRHWCVHT